MYGSEGKVPVYQAVLFGCDTGGPTQKGQCISDVNTLPALSKTGGRPNEVSANSAQNKQN